MAKVLYKPLGIAAARSGPAGGDLRASQAAVDRGGAEGFRKLTGVWPGD
jgi:hypothetical protein